MSLSNETSRSGWNRIGLTAASVVVLGTTACTSSSTEARNKAKPDDLQIIDEVSCPEVPEPKTKGHSRDAVRAAIQAALLQQETGRRWHQTNPAGSGGYNFAQPIPGEDGKLRDAAKLPPAVQYEYVEEMLENNIERGATWRQVGLTLINPNFATEITPCNEGNWATYADRVVDLTNEYLEDPSQIPRVPGVPKREYSPEG